MTTDNYDDNLILGYIEDELTADQKAAFERTLAADPRLASLVASMKQDHQMLCDLDQVTAPMELGDYVSSQLERQMLLCPLPQRRKHNPAVRSTPQARSNARTMRIFAYGSLAAMFMVVVGLMYNHIGTQSLIQRTEQLAFGTKSHEDSPTVAMDTREIMGTQPDSIDRLMAEPLVLPQTQNEPPTPEISSSSTPAMAYASDAAKAKEQVATSNATTLDWDESRQAKDTVASDWDAADKRESFADHPAVAMNAPQPLAKIKSTEREAGKRELMAMAPTPVAPAASLSPAVEELKKHSPTMSRMAMDDKIASTDKQSADGTTVITTSPVVTGTVNLSGDSALSATTNADNLHSGIVKGDSQSENVDMPVATVIPETVTHAPLVADTSPAMNQLVSPMDRSAIHSGNVAKPLPRRLGEVAAVRSMTIMPGDAKANQTTNQLTQAPPVCIIQSQQPSQTVIQITQWAIRNKVEIITPIEPEKSRAKNEKQLKEKRDSSKPAPKEADAPLRQVITLNIPANQVPVLVQWLNNQPTQSNNWIAPLPQANTLNDSYQRLQQELPLAPTLPLLKPDEPMQLQLMVVPDPRPQTPGQ
jgi:hypothetical protein